MSSVTSDNFPVDRQSHLHSNFVKFLQSSSPLISTPWRAEEQKACLPPFAGDDTHLLTVSLQSDSPRLPPLIIWRIDNMENISIFKTKPLTWQPTVLALVIVKHCSERNKKRQQDYFWVFSCTENPSSIWYPLQHDFLGLQSLFWPQTDISTCFSCWL